MEVASDEVLDEDEVDADTTVEFVEYRVENEDVVEDVVGFADDDEEKVDDCVDGAEGEDEMIVEEDSVGDVKELVVSFVVVEALVVTVVRLSGYSCIFKVPVFILRVL